MQYESVADPKILKGRGTVENNLSAPFSFIANAHNEIYAFYTRLFEKNMNHTAPLESSNGTNKFLYEFQAKGHGF